MTNTTAVTAANATPVYKGQGTAVHAAAYLTDRNGEQYLAGLVCSLNVLAGGRHDSRIKLAATGTAITCKSCLRILPAEEPEVAEEVTAEEDTAAAATAPVAYCTAGHYDGNKPQLAPVAGNNDRAVAIFVVYHGRAYLDKAGTVVPHPARMTYADATEAIARHEAGLPLPVAERRILEDLTDRGIDPRAVATRRAPLHLSRLQRRGLITLDAAGVPTIVDEVAALVALGRACGDHDRPLPCLECQA